MVFSWEKQQNVIINYNNRSIDYWTKWASIQFYWRGTAAPQMLIILWKPAKTSEKNKKCLSLTLKYKMEQTIFKKLLSKEIVFFFLNKIK